MIETSSSLAIAFFAAAMLYSSVGHGGASAYLAVMALAGFAPEVMRPCALWMNLAVSAIATFAFLRAGHFRLRLFWPFAVTAIPMAFIGGCLHVRSELFLLLVAISLVVAAIRLFLPESSGPLRPLPIGIAMACGIIIGLLSGLVGIGGGIFLTPLLLLAGWAGPRGAAAVSAPFIFVNSAAALAGMAGGSVAMPTAFPIWLAAAVAGGMAGAFCGSRLGRPVWLRPVLGAVLLIASAKFGMQLLS
ncbi:MAG: sulfite exporter TauE/SafE family protein [Verrucomicrobiaceae bacterium]|nr:MAG: sulfite exporter TauE/SafE family protein [Verrucomicrobiaceae bacterium]